jgi:carboxymethylenebutenolidase
MKARFILALILITAVSSFAASSKDVSYKSGDETVHALFYTPKTKGPFPAIIVVHEWWGLDDWMKEQASKLADEGYAALAIDLYRGKIATTSEVAHERMRGVPEDRAARDLHAAFEFLKTQPEVKADHIGAIGWCMGGGYALDIALAEPGLRADVINYGHLATDEDDLKDIHAAILGIFGGQDRGIPADDVRKFEQQLRKLGKKVEVQIYPNAGHGFQNPINANGYRKDDTADAWQRIVSFLAANLKQ